MTNPFLATPSSTTTQTGNQFLAPAGADSQFLAPAQTTVNGLQLGLDAAAATSPEARLGFLALRAARALGHGIVETARDLDAVGSAFGAGAQMGVDVRNATEADVAALLQSQRQQQLTAPRRTPEQVEEDETRIVRGLAFLGSLAAEEAVFAAKAIAGLAPLVRRALAAPVGGAAYGATRPLADDESRADAIAQDAAIFGLLGVGVQGLLGAVVGRRVKPKAEELRPAGGRAFEVVGTRPTPPVPTTPTLLEMQHGITERMLRERPDVALRAVGELSSEARAIPALTQNADFVVELSNGERRVLQTERGATAQTTIDAADAAGPQQGALARVLDDESGFARVEHDPPIPPEVADRVRIQQHARDLGPWGHYMAPVHTWRARNPIAGLINDEGIRREALAKTRVAEWSELIARTRKTLKAPERAELGQLLDAYVRGEDLPQGTPQKLATWFGEWRQKLSADRAELAAIQGASPEWGIDAYFMHVFAGDWRVVDQVTGKAIAGFEKGGFYRTFAEARDAAVQHAQKNPAAKLDVRPNEWLWDQDAALAVGPRKYKRIAGVKWWGHTEPRAANLTGFLADPTEAAAIYARGFARKVAFHDFGKIAQDAIAQIPRHGPQAQPVLADALTDYVGAVLGQRTQLESAWNSMIRYMFQNAPDRLQGVGNVLEMRTISTTIRRLESWWRLGWSPISAFVNYSQTWVNTASKIGYTPVLRAHKMLAEAVTNKQLGASTDAILRDLGVEYAVHLADSDIYKSVGKLSWWHPLYLFNKVEDVNRSVAGLAGYIDALDKGLPREVALTAGRQLMQETQFIYGVSDLPRALAGPVGQVIGQFKPFLLNELHFIAGLRGAEIPRFAINLAAAGGVSAVLSLPPLALVNLAVDKLTGESLVERAQKLAPNASRGIPGAAGVDVGTNVSIGGGAGGVIDLRPGPAVEDIGAILALAGDAFLRKIVKQEGVLSAQDRAALARRLMQVQTRRFWDAYQLARRKQVVQPTTGVPIFTPQSIERETALTALGMRSVERSEEERKVNVARGVTEVYLRGRNTYIKQMLEAREAGNFDEMRRLWREAQQKGYAITRDNLVGAVERKGKTAFERALQRAPARQRTLIQRRAEGDTYLNDPP